MDYWIINGLLNIGNISHISNISIYPIGIINGYVGLLYNGYPIFQ